VITALFCVSHLWIHIWVVLTRWKMPRLFPPKTPHKYNKAVVSYLTILLAVLISGNIINPGDWPLTVNIVVWGLWGAMYVWYPFMVPFAMFIAECQTHKIRLHSFQEKITERNEESTTTLSSAEISGITAYYFSLARSISGVNNTFRIVLPLQLFNLVLAILTNISQTVVTSSMNVDSFGTDFMTISIVSMMLLQVGAPLFYAASCNNAGDRALRAIALYPELVVLLHQSSRWTPYIRLCGVFNGFKITYRSLLYAVPLLIFYIYSLLKVLGPSIFDTN